MADDSHVRNPELTALSALTARLNDGIDINQVGAIEEQQQEIMQTLLATNRRLQRFVQTSVMTNDVLKEIEEKRDKLKEMQGDLMHVTQKIKIIKMRVRNQHPDAMDKAEVLFPDLHLPDD